MTQLNIVLTDSSVVVIGIPAALIALDSGATAASQTGYSAVDQLVRAIFRAGVFTDGKGTWYAATQIKSVTAS
jgi:hypothetical protein